MTKLTGFLLGIFVCLCVVFYCEHAKAADIHVQHNGAETFCATNLGSIGGNNTWNFTGECIAPPPPPPAVGRITNSNIAYVPATGSVRFTGLSDWSDIWGHASPFDATVTFPGRPNSQPTILNFRRDGYVCVKIHPASLSPSFGFITHTEYNYGADLTAAISNACGNFAPPNPLCLKSSQSGQPIINWTTRPATYRTFCPVTVGADQYLNIKLTNPTQGSASCPANASQCAIGTANSYGGG